MGFRFRKSVKLGGGVKLNFGKRSAGVSFGGKHGGVSINSRSGVRARTSIPGTGISYTTRLSGGKKSQTSNRRKTRAPTASMSRNQVKAVTRGAETAQKKRNPPKPPKSQKTYLVCGIIIVPFGILMVFLFWPAGLFFTCIGIYYIVCGPKIYKKLVDEYKEVHPDFIENK